MAKNSSGFVDLIVPGLNAKTVAFVKLIEQTLAQSEPPATGEQPAQRFSGPLSKYKDSELSSIRQDLEALSSALKLWLSEPSQAVTAATDAPSTAAGQVEQQAKGGETDVRAPTTISAFLQTVGEAVITAQGELDKSLTAPDNANVSAAYRIPKLSAEIAFEVEKVDERGVSILLASRNSTERESLKQKVSFDIVATPLPAELSARNQLAAIILNTLPEGDPWRKRLAGATLLRQARGTLALSLEGEGGPAVLVAPDAGEPVQGPLRLDGALGKALESIAAKA